MYVQNDAQTNAVQNQSAGGAGVVETTSVQGESLNDAGTRYGVSPENMAAANPHVANPDTPMTAGTSINVPVGEGEGMAKVHTVEHGQSVADVAEQHNVSEDAVRAANGLGAGQEPYAGNMLILPANGGAATSPAATSLSDAAQELTELFPSLAGRSEADLQKILDNMDRLENGDINEQIQAVAELTRDLQPEDMKKLVEELGLKDNPIASLLTDSKALGALSTLADPNASAADKAQAALTLASSVGKLAPGELGQALKPFLGALPSASALIDALDTWSNPDASALDKAKATLDLAKALKNSLGDAFPHLLSALDRTDSTLSSLSAALTLLDPEASVEDKAKAALELTAEVPEIAGDIAAIKDFLSSNGLSKPDVEAIANAINQLPIADRLPESVRNNIDPEVAKNLTPEQADELARLAANGDLSGDLSKVLGKIKDPAAMTALLDSLAGAGDANGQKALLSTLSGLKDGELDRLLTSTIDGRPAGEVLNEVIGKLDKDADGKVNKEVLDKFTKMLGELDGDSLKFALRLGTFADAQTLNATLKAIDDPKMIGQALKGLDAVFGKLNLDVTADIAGKVLKGLSKMIPVAGAVPAGIDAVRMAEIAADPNMPADIRYLAAQAAKLNGADAALSVAEPFIAAAFGIPIAVDIAIGVAALALDLVISEQVSQFEQQGSAYEAPGWLQAANVAIAAVQGPQGAAELALFYGPEGAMDLVGSVTEMGGELAIKATELQATLAAQGIGEGMEMTAEGLHLLADIIRNPEKYGEAAVAMGQEALAKLNEIANGVGELAQAAAQELGNLVNDLKEMGERGIEALTWIASNPGEAAKLAVNALSNLAQQGLELATEAGEALAKKALEALETARGALEAAGEVAKDVIDAINGAVSDFVDSAVELGRQGIELLGWIANNPGEAAEIAKQALVDVASQAGEFAKDAYDQIVQLGEAGVELIKDVADRLVDAGEAGVEILKYIVENPGEAAEAVRDAALKGLQTIAEGVGDAAIAAADAVVDLVNHGIEQAQEIATNLLTQAGEAAQRIIDTWSKELTEGGKAVIEGLKDLGDAGLEALGKMADAGINFAKDVLDSIGGFFEGVWNWATGR